MHIDVIIPTYGKRMEMLKRTVTSLQSSGYKDLSIFVVVDGDKAAADETMKMDVAMLFNHKRMDYIYSINRGFAYAKGDLVLNYSDEITLHPNCLQNAVTAMKEKFPDGNGAISLKQRQKRGGAAFCLYGRKLLDRFPDNQVWCPDYIHYYGDREMDFFLTEANLIYLCREAVVEHWRGNDETKQVAMSVHGRDMLAWKKRRRAGGYWGKDFGRVEK